MAMWKPARLAPEDKEVLTRIADARGIRKEMRLVKWNNLWWLPDRQTYVDHRPTHYLEVKGSTSNTPPSLQLVQGGLSQLQLT